MVLLYRLWVRRVERRAPEELALRRAGGLLAGMGWGALLVAASITPAAVLSAYTVEAIRLPPRLAADLAFWVYVAVGQEIAFRGLLLRLLKSRVGAPAAVVISSAAFGAFHLINPHATLWAAGALALQSVGAYALPYLISRNLWLPIGAHLAWNITEASLIGAPDSGVAYAGVLLPHISGPAWLTGGAFGPEASAPAVLACLAAAGLLLFLRSSRRADMSGSSSPRP